MKKFALLFLIQLASCYYGISQVVSWSPYFFGEQDSVVIIFDASQGNAALNNYNGNVYAHTGVLTSGGAGWQHVKSTWGMSDSSVLMTPLGNNLYSISFVPRTYYNVPSGEIIYQLAFVFRNADGSIVGRNMDGSDIYIPLQDPNKIDDAIISPVSDPGGPVLIVSAGQMISFTGIAEYSANLEFKLNGNSVATAFDSILTTNISSAQIGINWVTFTANDGSTQAVDSISFLENPQIDTASLAAGVKDGVTYLDDSTVIFNLYAPAKSFVYVLGDFNNWQIDTAYFMHRTPDSTRYWLRVSGLIPHHEYVYQYLIDGALKVADPYSEKVLDPQNDNSIGSATYPNPTPYPAGLTSGIASVLQTAQTPYTWTVSGFQKPKKTDLVIYELLVRDFTSRHNYQGLIDTLGYLERLGINAIELMPVNEFEGNESWGYNPSFLFAPDKYYGTKEKLKEFIDTCHSRGIAVLMDIVLNHQCGQSPMVQMYFNNATGKPATNNPWFNVDPRHDFNVCYDMNHDSPATRYYVDRVTEYWINEFHFDGFRFDLAKGFTQTYTLGNISLFGHYDSTRVYNIKRMSDHIRSIDSSSLIILELFADNSEEQVYSAYGLMMWGNDNYNYNQATMGFASGSDFSYGVSYKSRGWTSPNLISYMESHDEERLMYKNLTYGNSSSGYNVKDLQTGLERMEMAGAMFFTVPGPKMIWQGGELGYDVSVNSPCRLCNRPFKWNYFYDPARQHLYNVWKALIKLRIDHPAFESTDFNIQAGSLFKKMHVNDALMNVTVVANFDVVSGNIIPLFQNTGWWYDYLSGDSIYVTNVTDNLNLQPGEYHVYTSVRLAIPDLSIGINKVEIPNESMVSFPNPFSDITNIYYSLSNAGYVNVSIYDLSGRLIKIMVNENQQAGIHELFWNSSENKAAPGMYICKLTYKGHSENIKLVIQ